MKTHIMYMAVPGAAAARPFSPPAASGAIHS